MLRGRLAGTLLLAAASTLLSLFALELVVRYALEPASRGNLTPVPSQLRMSPSIPGVPYELRPDMEGRPITAYGMPRSRKSVASAAAVIPMISP